MQRWRAYGRYKDSDVIDKTSLLSSKGEVSSMRYAMMLCVKCSVGIALFSIVGYFVCVFCNKEIDSGFFSGIALVITPFLACSMGGKATQSFAEKKVKNEREI